MKPAEAWNYLGISRAHFYAHVAPLLPRVRMGNRVAWWFSMFVR